MQSASSKKYKLKLYICIPGSNAVDSKIKM